MYDASVKSQFIQLRAQGWSLPRIAAQLNVGQRTLVDWNRESQKELAEFKVLEREALHERILACHAFELSRLVRQLEQVEEVIAQRDPKNQTTPVLWRQAAALRSQIRKLQENPLLGAPLYPVNPPPAAAPEPENS